MKEMGYRSMEYTKVQQQMNDIVGDNVKKLAQLFPAAVKDGEVDFEALKEELGQFAWKQRLQKNLFQSLQSLIRYPSNLFSGILHSRMILR